MQAARKVTVIPATLIDNTGPAAKAVKTKRVAAYARVSTDSDEQLTSYEAQVDHYTKYISSHVGWEFAGMYSDEGISGVMTKNRDGFNQMVEDALAGKIDLIITKSISRFARNTVDILTNVRLLKEHGIEVYFEKENIYSMDAKGEVLLTIMGSLAQEESRSISENVKWGQRKRFQDGKVTIPYKHFLGYKKGKDGLPEIVPKEAIIIKSIYRMFLVDGMTLKEIADSLTSQGEKTPTGKDNWVESTVQSILQNEKYKGAARLQKSFTVDYLTKKKKVNEGEVPQYYVEHSHPAIIDPEEWDEVQLEFERRKAVNGRYRNDSPFSGKLVCSECGGIYGMKVWHSNDKYRSISWQCNNKYHKGSYCSTPHIKEHDLMELATDVLNEYFQDKSRLADDLEEATKLADKRDAILNELAIKMNELEVTANLIKQSIERGKDTTTLSDKYTALQEEKTQLDEKLSRMEMNVSAMRKTIKALRSETQFPIKFNDRLWKSVMKQATVYDTEIVFEFYDGTKISREI